MPDTTDVAERRHGFLDRRRAGVLLHPTSLPSGTLGDDAYRFVDFLAASGFGVWQFLPLGPTHGEFGSPYQCLSVHAGNPWLIDARALVREGWVSEQDIKSTADFHALLARARAGFENTAAPQLRNDYAMYLHANAHWLDDYALFQALRRACGNKHWIDWDTPLRDRDTYALAAARAQHAESIELVRFEQFVFHRQWKRLKDYANKKDVLLFGDMPIFVAHDSADVWAQRDQFYVDAHGHLLSMAGVPPDYFSSTGQLWGNPHYNWDAMIVDDFRWWRQRCRGQAVWMDILRIDHFRGFEAYWEIPAGAQTAIDGRWVKAPGDALFTSVCTQFPQMKVVAEDLGIITPEVTALRHRHGFPGMKILQFAFDSDASNPYLPHNCTVGSVAYTGTHDNDTTVGWYNTLSPESRTRVAEYLGHPSEAMPWPLIRAALECVSQLAVIPMQDLLALDGSHRMNTPGTVEGNWRWRYQWQQVDPGLVTRMRTMLELYRRV